MKSSVLGHLTEPLKELLGQYSLLLSGYKERHPVRLAGVCCDAVPMEIISSAGITPFRIPSNMVRAGCRCPECGSGPEMNSLFDMIIIPGGCALSVPGSDVPVYRFNIPGGYGEAAAEKLHDSIDNLLRNAGAGGVENLDLESLKESAERYNIIRKLVRGICGLRQEKPWLLSNADLFKIFESAVSLPAELTAQYMNQIFNSLNAAEKRDCSMRPVLVHGSMMAEPGVLDEIEDAGCLVIEDDLCNGRRQFDLSHNPSSEYLYYEMLNDYSCRPLCPAVRQPSERFDLFYRMLRSYGIETVIFLDDAGCDIKMDESEYLRVKLMRSGVDPLFVSMKNAGDAVRDYLSKIK
jgi:hypothetical protein